MKSYPDKTDIRVTRMLWFSIGFLVAIGLIAIATNYEY